MRTAEVDVQDDLLSFEVGVWIAGGRFPYSGWYAPCRSAVSSQSRVAVGQLAGRGVNDDSTGRCKPLLKKSHAHVSGVG